MVRVRVGKFPVHCEADLRLSTMSAVILRKRSAHALIAHWSRGKHQLDDPDILYNYLEQECGVKRKEGASQGWLKKARLVLRSPSPERRTALMTRTDLLERTIKCLFWYVVIYWDMCRK